MNFVDNVVVLMGGQGSRFSNAGHLLPKWAIVEPRSGKSLLALSTEDLVSAVGGASWFFVVQGRDLDQVELASALTRSPPSMETVRLVEYFSGPLATLREALTRLSLPEDSSLLVQVCDTYLPITIENLRPSRPVFGVVYCFNYDAENLCHVIHDGQENLVSLAEKVLPLSDRASSGAFFFSRVGTLRKYLDYMLSKSPPRSSGEYFVSDAINLMLMDGFAFESRVVPNAASVGTPAELQAFKGPTIG